jgi:hypothetical protein
MQRKPNPGGVYSGDMAGLLVNVAVEDTIVEEDGKRIRGDFTPLL